MITAKVIGTQEVIDKLKRFYPSLREELRAHAQKFMVKTINYIVTEKLSAPEGPSKFLHHRSGTLIESIGPGRGSSVDDEGNVTIGTNLEYAAIHEFGGKTRPHDIRPVNAQALRFELKSKTAIFRKVVHHPGSKIPARSFLHSTLKEKQEEWRKGLTDCVRRTLEK